MISRYTRTRKPINRTRLLKNRGTISFGSHEISRRQLVISALVCVCIGLVSVLGMFFWISRHVPDPNTIASEHTPVSTKIYDRTGEHLLFEIFKSERRTPVALQTIPEYVKWATIAIEDKDFYKHQGFSFRGMIRAVFVNILQGGFSQGGSTITQQYVKKAVLTDEKKISRKIKEVIYAYQIERKYTKDQILELYLNQIPYGGSAYGIEAASLTFFGKHVFELTIREASVLASLPQAPSYYSPYGNHTDALLGRADYVLKLMHEQGYLSDETFASAQQEPVVFKQLTDSIQAPHFVMYIREQIASKYGERVLQEGGLRVVTTLDYKKQQIAERVVREGAERNAKTSKASNAALVSMDPKTGEVLAMVGSKDYFDESVDGNVNVAIRPRQPGSSFKPIVYAAAFQLGYTPETILFDLETKFPAFEGPYTPKNYDGKEHGPVSLRTSLAGSLNITSVKLLYLAGINNVLNLADSLGYSTLGDRSRFGLSLVLGGGEVKLLEHVRAYSAFARDGLLPETHTILNITNKEGEVLEEYKPTPQGKKIMEPNIVRMINSILSDTEARKFVFGNSPYLTLSKRPVAVKTGTTNDYRDAWTVGYTPSLVTGVWVGNNNNTEMMKGSASAMVAAPIWDAYMEEALNNTPVETFKAPEVTNLSSKPMLNGQYLWKRVLEIDKNTGQPSNPFTPQEQKEYREINEVHSILYYVDKDNPLGPSPKKPENDPQYESWEEPVRAWAAKNGYVSSTLPYTPPSSNEKLFVKITSPSDNSEILSPEFVVTILTTTQNSLIDRVEYYLGGNQLGTSNQPPFSLQTTFPDVAKKKHDLKAVLYDKDGNSTSDTITVSNEQMTKSQFQWVNPTQGQSVSEYPINLTLTTTGDTTKVDYYLVKNSDSQWIGFQTMFTDSRSIFTWNPPSPGVFQVYAVVTKSNGDIVKTQLVTFSTTQ